MDGDEGFGNSGRQELGPELRRSWLQSFFIALNLPSSVVVSPSFSGVYSLPMLALQSHELAGFIPVAVDATDEVPVSYLQNIMVSVVCLLFLFYEFALDFVQFFFFFFFFSFSLL